MSNVPTFRRSLETQELVARLTLLQEGQLISYEDLSVIAGEQITGASSILQTAKRIVENESGYVLSVERGVGVRRLDDSQIVEDTHGARVKIARQSKRALKRLSGVKNFDALTEEQRRTHQAHAVIYAVISEKASSKSIKRVSSTVKVDGNALLAAIREEMG